MPSLVKRFIASESESTALEYGLVAAGITVVAVTETPTPRGTTFEEWQTRQLRELEASLATGAAT